MSLEEKFRAAKMQFLSVDRLANGRWEATYRSLDRKVMRQAEGVDPVTAIEAVLSPAEDLLI